MANRFGTIAGNVAKTLLIGEGQTERFTFKRYDGKILRQVVASNGTYPDDKIEAVTLRINPESVEHQQPRLTQKVQTNSPGRFVIFDWGVDLRQMTIDGNTGNLLPDVITGGLDPISPVVDFYKSQIVPDADIRKERVLTNIAEHTLLANTPYFDILNMSPKYRVFVKLQNLYLKFDADRDICLLEFADFIYRIFFIDFNFRQEANSPWNWKYTIQLNVLEDLKEFARKGDPSINNTNFVSS